ncbi:lipopolysaccharide biosynthesis protein [Gemmatirosa kalamazoonensis]|uniref:Lipopolysaccharide biosynthesis protein n=1 Tax=Gemmatirosa kalamazoonensis TaxID=861299 RepID=W0RIU3_9BACT|nr:GNVR domain-containing protein [Gemmatirosa kalamazoonensis]AHG91024.1 lipopolysaccharide biosynthesis protein [Gemmatirosa kalamazoonensis]
MTAFAPVVSTRPGAVAETIDLFDVGRSLRRQWLAIALGLALGLAAAAAVLLLAPRRFVGESTVLLRSATDPSASLLSRVGLPTDLGGGALGNAIKSPMETELALLASRDVIGSVVDSLGLQARVLGRAGVPSRWLIQPAPYAGAFRKQRFAFDRQPDGRYRVTGDSVSLLAAPGTPFRLPVVGTVTLVPRPALASFRVQFDDREDAVQRLGERLGVDKRGGEVAAVGYTASDSVTAAEVPNAIVETYLARRRTVDRGVNTRRYEFLVLQADSVSRQLAVAENALRREQEASGVFDPELSGRTGVEAARALREQAGALEVERRAIGQLLADVQAGRLSPRQLAAYPSFLKSDAVNALLTQMSGLETQRTMTLERRTEKDPEIVAMSGSIAQLERQLVPLARAYQQSLDQQVGEVDRQLAVVESRLTVLPGQAEASVQRQRDVKRLSQTLLALQSQIVDTRLAAIGEGGQVRQIDVAESPKRPAFPRPVPTLLVGALGGLLLGTVWALFRGARRMVVPWDVERATGLPGVVVRPGEPVLLGAGVRSGTILVLGAEAGHDAACAAVARAVGASLEQRGLGVIVVDGQDGQDHAALRAAVAVAEVERDVVVVAARTLRDPATVALLEPPRRVLLAARAGATPRRAIVDALDALSRLAVPCLGVALLEPDAWRVDAPRPARPTTDLRLAPRATSAPRDELPAAVTGDGR